MTTEERRFVLQFIEDNGFWPEVAGRTEQLLLIEQGFAHEAPPGEVYLTSLGELEIGHPETKDAGFVYSQHEKECAQIIDQLMPVLIKGSGIYIGPEMFRALTKRLAEILPEKEEA